MALDNPPKTKEFPRPRDFDRSRYDDVLADTVSQEGVTVASYRSVSPRFGLGVAIGLPKRQMTAMFLGPRVRVPRVVRDGLFGAARREIRRIRDHRQAVPKRRPHRPHQSIAPVTC
jgi:hypothetical protein